MDRVKPLYTPTAAGLRNGRTESSDGVVRADVSVSKEMGGPGAVSIGPREAGGFGLQVKHAMRGNVDVAFEVVGS
jgi:hypothetical protein